MSRSFSTTSRYSPVTHIRIGPFGVCTSMHTRRVPPTRTSIFATGIVAPSGPYQALKCSGSVHICQTRAAGASTMRSISTASAEPLSIIALTCLRGLELFEVVVHPVEAGLPDGPVAFSPGRDLLQWRRVQGARSVLGSVAPHHQAGPFQHLDVFGDGRKRHLERLGELVDGRPAFGETGEDRSPGRVGQRGEGLAEPVLVDRRRHSSYFPEELINRYGKYYLLPYMSILGDGNQPWLRVIAVAVRALFAMSGLGPPSPAMPRADRLGCPRVIRPASSRLTSPSRRQPVALPSRLTALARPAPLKRRCRPGGSQPPPRARGSRLQRMLSRSVAKHSAAPATPEPARRRIVSERPRAGGDRRRTSPHASADKTRGGGRVADTALARI